MPIPSPHKHETQKDFFSRCMGNAIMVREFPDQKQRGGVCGTAWRQKSKSAAARRLQGRLDFQGLSISIENRKGGVRKGTDADGTEWRTKMKHPYGYIKGTVGADGDHVDCFVGPDKDAKNAYIVHIKNPKTGKYDEDKVMLGFNTKEEAEKSFRYHYDNPSEFLLSIDTMTIEELMERFQDDHEKGRRTRMLKAALVKNATPISKIIKNINPGVVLDYPAALVNKGVRRGASGVAHFAKKHPGLPGSKSVRRVSLSTARNPGAVTGGAMVLGGPTAIKILSTLGKFAEKNKILKSAEEVFINAFIETIEKKAGAGTYAASMLIPASILATIGSTIGALSNKENRGKGALIGAGIGTGMGVAGGVPIGRALSKILSNKNLSKNLNKKIHETAESIGKSFGTGTAKGVKKEMNPLSIFRKKRPTP